MKKNDAPKEEPTKPPLQEIRMGGLSKARPVNDHDPFEMAIARIMGDRLKHCLARSTYSLAGRLWGTLANATFEHTDGEKVSFSFRAAGDLIAAIRGEGNYLDWYRVTEEYDLRDPEVLELLAVEGWRRTGGGSPSAPSSQDTPQSGHL